MVYLGGQGQAEPRDHTLIFAPGAETTPPLCSSSAGPKSTSPQKEKAGDLVALLTNLEPGDVLFVDEIHRLSPVGEILYPAMEDTSSTS